MPMSDAERAYIDARSMLALEKNKERVVSTLQTRGVKAHLASDLVDQVFRDNQTENRKGALGKMVISALILAAFGGVYVATGRLFYIILPFAAFGLLWGIVSFLIASGYEIAADGGDD